MMKNKLAAIVTGAMLTLTAGILPSYAINSNQSPVSAAGTNLEAVNLDNAFNQAGNENLLIAQRRRRTRVRRSCRTVTRRIRRNGRIRRIRRRVCRTVRTSR
ncbi:MAG: hypothetical protein WBA41_12400 [Rivularia sp. (in: cyanobacteria)]